MKYASLACTANNIGEEIQIIAAQQFLPRVDAYMNKERLNTYKFNEDYKIILNGWWLRHPKRFYTNDNIHPLLISIHIDPIASKNFFTKKTIEYLIKNGPVGCRDYQTLEILQKHNIPAYFSGCLTLTLSKNPNITKKDYILAIDCSKNVIDRIKRTTGRPVYELYPHWHYYNSFEQRMLAAHIYLKKIQEAHCVITRRLHGALPAIALETPAIFIYDENFGYKLKERCGSYSEFLPFYTENDFLTKDNLCNFEGIAQNTKHLQLRENLISKCREFTGYYNNNSVVYNTTEDEDIMQLFGLLRGENNYNRRKVLYDVPIKYMIKNIYTRLILRKNDDDVL